MNPAEPFLVEHPENFKPGAHTKRRGGDKEREQVARHCGKDIRQAHRNQCVVASPCGALLHKTNKRRKYDEDNDAEEIIEQIVRRIVPRVNAFEVTVEKLVPQLQNLVPPAIGESNRGSQKPEQTVRESEAHPPRSRSQQPERRERRKARPREVREFVVVTQRPERVSVEPKLVAKDVHSHGGGE